MARFSENLYAAYIPNMLTFIKKTINLEGELKITYKSIAKLFTTTSSSVFCYFRIPEENKVSTPISAIYLLTFCQKYKIDPRSFLLCEDFRDYKLYKNDEELESKIKNSKYVSK